MLSVTDDGCGMDERDALLAFNRHATSKIKHVADLEELITMGFRGEALASIAAVSHIEMETRQPGSEQGFFLRLEAGKPVEQRPCGCAEGTTIRIRNLFFNTPARFKFLKKDRIEGGYVVDTVTRIALTRPDVSFRVFNEEKDVLHTPGNNDLKSTIYALYGREFAEALVPVGNKYESVSVDGYISQPTYSRNNRSRQIVIVNGRWITSQTIRSAIDEASKTFFMQGRFPALVLRLTIPRNLVDVNVHPQKSEVRFWNDQIVFRAVYYAIRQALEAHAGMATVRGVPSDSRSGANETTPSDQEPVPRSSLEGKGETAPIPSEDAAPLKPSAAEQLSASNTSTTMTQQHLRDVFPSVATEVPRPVIRYEKEVETEPKTACTVIQDDTLTQPEDQPEDPSDVQQPHGTQQRVPELLHAAVIGQLFGTYVILELRMR